MILVTSMRISRGDRMYLSLGVGLKLLLVALLVLARPSQSQPPASGATIAQVESMRLLEDFFSQAHAAGAQTHEFSLELHTAPR
jgi:hypothetical protein